MPLTAATILADLRANPLTFLRHYKLVIAGGGSKSNSGIATFSFDDKTVTVKGFTTGLSGMVGKTKDRPYIKFSHKSGLADPNPDVAGGKFNAHYVAMKQIGDDVRTTHYTLPGTGPDLMLTSQLSGCTFGIGSAAKGSQLVSHIQPNANATASDLHEAVADGLTSGGGKFFERQNGASYENTSNRATVVGVRNSGTWKFYAQIYKTGSGGALLEAKEL